MRKFSIPIPSHPLGNGGDEIGMEKFFGDRDGDGKLGRGSSLLQPCLGVKMEKSLYGTFCSLRSITPPSGIFNMI